MPITLIADENIAGLDEYFRLHADIHLIKMAGRAIPEALADVRPDALLIRSVAPINAQTLSTDSVRFIGSATLGIDHVDTAYLAQRGIAFAHAAGSSRHSVAQYVISAILTLRPELARPDAKSGVKIGIIGLGNIGATLADYAQDLGWQVAGYDPFLPTSAINNSSLEMVLASDVVSLHTPLTRTGAHPTAGMINAHTLAMMRPDALLINSARGEIIDEASLLADIAHTGRQVVLDVFPREPHVAGELLSRLALATPHIAGYTLDGKLRGTDMVYQALCWHFGLTARQSLDALLPPDAPTWQALKADFTHLPAYYDIRADDARLRAAAEPDVAPADFDALRKHYPLKREWVFYTGMFHVERA